MARQQSEGRSVSESVQQVARVIVTPPRTVLVLALGSIAVTGRALQSTANRLAEEGERQLTLFNRSLGRAAATLRPWSSGDTKPASNTRAADQPPS